MTDSRFALLDPSAGISGDMLLGALIAAGAPEDWLRGLPARLGLSDVTVEIRRTMRCGVSAVKVDVRVGGAQEGPAEEHHARPAKTHEDHGTVDDDGRARLVRGAEATPHDHAPHADAHGHPHHHDHGDGHHHHHHGDGHHHHHGDGHHHTHGDAHHHHHHHGEAHHHHHHGDGHHHHGDGHHHHHHGDGHHHHRHVADLVAIIERAPVSAWVRERAVRALRLVAEAEGRVHGMPADQVALHEVGAMDALVDIVGAVEGFEQLGLTRIATRPVALGSGWVTCAHGTMPVPAPASSILAESLAIAPNGPVTGEAATPTGLALLRVLATEPVPALWQPVQGDAWGAGGRDPQGWPNALRLIVAEASATAAAVAVLAADLDDVTPEYLEPIREAVVAAGALDLQVWTTLGKKGRPGFRLEALVPLAQAAAVETALLAHSPTIGVRRWTVDRQVLPRRIVEVRTSAGPIRVKISDAPGGPRAKAEYDDVAAAARTTGRPAIAIAREAEQVAGQEHVG